MKTEPGTSLGGTSAGQCRGKVGKCKRVADLLNSGSAAQQDEVLEGKGRKWWYFTAPLWKRAKEGAEENAAITERRVIHCAVPSLLPGVLVQTADVTGVVALVLIFGPFFYAVKRRYDLRERKELGTGTKERAELKSVQAENRVLRERVEHLETIVCSVDYELNEKIQRLVDRDSQMRALAAPEVAEQPASVAAVSGATHIPIGRASTAVDVARTETPPPPLGVANFRPGDWIENRYRVQQLLGRGGMGAVYLSHDQVLDEAVALKIIAPSWSHDPVDLAERFRREASAARRISHPRVIRIHDLGETRDGLLFMSMEYCAGKTLAQHMEQRGRLAPGERRDVLDQICEGLKAAHQAGVVHRDLKPHNVLIGHGGAVKLIDFGLAKASFQRGMTATGLILGTPEYMSPEQIRGGSVDHRSDIYSLGALAYHLVTGKPPFVAGSAIAIGFSHLSEEPAPPSQLCDDVPPTLESAILRALAKESIDRQQSVDEFQRSL